MKSSLRRGVTSGLVILLVLSTIAMAPTAASAAEQIAMLVPNIPGSSTLNGHAGWIDVVSFAGSAVAPTATGAGQPCQMVVQKPLDIASPHLWVATVTGQIFSTIKIDVVTVGTAAPFVLYEIQLENAEFTSIGDSGSNALPLESVTLKATKVMLTFNKQNPNGSVTPVTTSFTC